MKKFYLFTFLFSFVLLINAQVNLPVVNPQSTNIKIQKKFVENQNLKTVSCIDTVAYPASKLSGFPEIDTMDLSTYISGVSQAYYFASSGSISGINTYLFLDSDGIPGNSSPITMTIKVYDIDGGNYPTTLIDSADVQVVDIGFLPQPLFFASPINVTDSFAVSIEINATFPSNPYYVTNTSANNDGNGEKLSCAKYLGVWYNAFDDFGGWDMDVMLEPIFTTNTTSTYTTDKDSICPNDTVVFTNSSTVIPDAMFNLYNTTSSPLYTWDFNDGTGTYNTFDTSYVFSAPGTYNTQLTASYYGYTANCMDVNSVPIIVHDTAMANFGFTHQGGGVYQFNDSSANGNVYAWDFGDGSPVDNSQNPSHTYSTPNNYTVCLTVTDSNGCNVDSMCQVITFALSVDEQVVSNNVVIYPIPANKYFYVDVPNKYYGGDIIVSDVVGKALQKKQIESNRKNTLTTESLASGIYFVSIEMQGERVYTQRIVVDK